MREWLKQLWSGERKLTDLLHDSHFTRAACEEASFSSGDSLGVEAVVESSLEASQRFQLSEAQFLLLLVDGLRAIRSDRGVKGKVDTVIHIVGHKAREWKIAAPTQVVASVALGVIAAYLLDGMIGAGVVCFKEVPEAGRLQRH